MVIVQFILATMRSAPHGLLIVLVLLATGCGPQAGAPQARMTSDNVTDSGTEQQTVSLRFDFGDGRERIVDAVTWRQAMTVMDALLLAKAAPDGIDFEHRGSGTTAFVESIDGVGNTGSDKNWIFTVNGKKSETGAGSYGLNAGDAVLWRYTKEL